METFESLNNILPWTLYHHERWDGKGYPEGKAGADIPLEAQIIAIADAFDAMMTSRPYRQSMGLEKAFSEIERNNGIQWRRDVTEAFLLSVKEKQIKADNIICG